MRFFPSLNPLVWQSLSAADLQSGAPFVETGQIVRPVAIDAGLASRESVSAASLVASLARAFKSSMVSPGLLRDGKIDRDFSNIFPSSLNRPGFSSGLGETGGGAGSLGGATARSGVVCWEGGFGEDGGELACGHAMPPAIVNIDNARLAVERRVLHSPMRVSSAT